MHGATKYIVAVSCSILSLVCLTSGQTVDLTLTVDASGRDVVDAVIYKITASKIFPSDYNFLKRVAYVESRYGVNNITTNGGIWRIREAIYLRTKNVTGFPTLIVTPIANISTAFAINWLTTTYADLRKPLYSGLAMSLYLASLNMTIPQTLISQGTFWQANYNQNISRNATNYVTDATNAETAEGTCSGRMDLVIVCDGSGSIGLNDFNTAKQFIINLMATFDIESTRMGCMFYSTNSTPVFPLNHTLSLKEMQAAVTAFQYQGGWTFTNNALETAVGIFNNANVRAGLPRIMALFTDGMSTEKNVSNIALAKALGVVSFAVGIGSAINETELTQIAYGDTARVYKLDSYDSLKGFQRYLNSETCGVPITPRIGQVVADAVKLDERRYFKYDLSDDNNVKVMIDTTNGDTMGYYSFSVENPNSALHDGVLGDDIVIRVADAENLRRKARSVEYLDADAEYPNVVYVAVQGMMNDMNNYTIQAMPVRTQGKNPMWLILILGVAYVGVA